MVFSIINRDRCKCSVKCVLNHFHVQRRVSKCFDLRSVVWFLQPTCAQVVIVDLFSLFFRLAAQLLASQAYERATDSTKIYPWLLLLLQPLRLILYSLLQFQQCFSPFVAVVVRIARVPCIIFSFYLIFLSLWCHSLAHKPTSYTAQTKRFKRPIHNHFQFRIEQTLVLVSLQYLYCSRFYCILRFDLFELFGFRCVQSTDD